MALVRRQEAGLVPVELTRFVPEEWPASEADIELSGETQRSAFQAWIRWIHARAHFGTRYGVGDDLIPDHTTRATFRRVEDSLRTKARSAAPGRAVHRLRGYDVGAADPNSYPWTLTADDRVVEG